MEIKKHLAIGAIAFGLTSGTFAIESQKTEVVSKTKKADITNLLAGGSGSNTNGGAGQCHGKCSAHDEPIMVLAGGSGSNTNGGAGQCHGKCSAHDEDLSCQS